MKKGSSKKSIKSGATKQRTPYTGSLPATNSSKRKNQTDIRPQSK
jgi:hypothetical protein